MNILISNNRIGTSVIDNNVGLLHRSSSDADKRIKQSLLSEIIIEARQDTEDSTVNINCSGAEGFGETKQTAVFNRGTSGIRVITGHNQRAGTSLHQRSFIEIVVDSVLDRLGTAFVILSSPVLGILLGNNMVGQICVTIAYYKTITQLIFSDCIRTVLGCDHPCLILSFSLF